VPIDCRENWSRNVAFNPRCRYQPKDESEVLRILADHPKGPIRVVGSCHSMNDIAKSSEVWIDMTQYKADWKWDLDGTPPTVTVPATSMSTDPAVFDVIWTVQDPPVVVQVLTPPTNDAFAVFADRLNVSVVPFGTFAQPVTPSPP